jgi:hypothetical protein
MKNTRFMIVGVLAALLTFGLVLTGCDLGGDDNNSGSGSLDTRLVAKWHATQADANNDVNSLFEISPNGVIGGSISTWAGEVKLTTSNGIISTTTSVVGSPPYDTGSAAYAFNDTGTGLNFSNPNPAAMALSGLINYLIMSGNEYFFKKAGSGGGAAVDALNLTAHVSAPVKNAAPVTTAIDASQYTGTIAWRESNGTTPVSGNFQPSTVYKAIVTLTAKTGYTFNGVAAGSFSHNASSETPVNAANSGTVTITFPATAGANESTRVNALDLTTYVTAPVKDAAPVTTTINAPQYTGTIAWQLNNGISVSGNFQPSTVYKAIVDLEAKTGYTFNGVAADSFTHTASGASAANMAGSGTVTITFPATEGQTVNALDLTDYVTPPVKGAAPDGMAIDADQYTGTIAWRESNGTTAVNGNFRPATVYKAIVTLTAKSGYTFTGVEANSFIHEDSEETQNVANGRIVIITFPATEGQTVDALNLTAYVTRPVKNAAPNTTAINADQYTGTIAWRESDGTTAVSGNFQPATVYKAIVTLTAKTGYTFDGVAAGSFTHGASGASVTNDAGSGTVTITFAATAAADADTVVDAFDLTAYVTRPVKGAAPVTGISNASQYTGTIAWKENQSNGMTDVSGNFKADTVYIAIVTLTAKSGYTFNGVAADSFIHEHSDGTLKNAADSGTVTITFAATEADEALPGGTGTFQIRITGIPADFMAKYQPDSLGILDDQGVAIAGWITGVPGLESDQGGSGNNRWFQAYMYEQNGQKYIGSAGTYNIGFMLTVGGTNDSYGIMFKDVSLTVNALNTFNFNAGEEAVFPDDEYPGGDENSNEVSSITLSGFPISGRYIDIELSDDSGPVAMADRGSLTNGSGGPFYLFKYGPSYTQPVTLTGSYYITIKSAESVPGGSYPTCTSIGKIKLANRIEYNRMYFDYDDGTANTGSNDGGDKDSGPVTAAAIRR